MIELGTIPIKNETSIIEARNKIRLLAEDLRFGSIIATRLATVTSELSRRMVVTSHMSDIKVALDKRDGSFGLILLFISGQPVKTLAVNILKTVFDDVEVAQTTGGLELITAFKLLPDTEFEPTKEFIDKERGLVQPLTTEELYLQLREYSENLEEMVEERTGELQEKTVELEQANISLQEVDRLKSVFLASMSHELRTPLNSIIGFTGIILQGMSGEVNEEQRKQLTMVKNSASHLLSLINDVLDISKIESGRVEFSLEEFSLDDVVREVVDSFSSAVSEKGLELTTQMPEGITLPSDKRHIKQILLNLVSNAVKFTDQGSVKVAARALRDENLEVRVIDTGIGIKQEDMDKLFQPFQQISEPLVKSREGTGLGLYISQKLAALLGGDISAKSEYGRGSEFTFTIPLRYKEG